MSGVDAAIADPRPIPSEGTGQTQGKPSGPSYAEKTKGFGKAEYPNLELKNDIEFPDLFTLHAFIREDRTTMASLVMEEFLTTVRTQLPGLRVQDCIDVSTVRGWRVVNLRGATSWVEARNIAKAFNEFAERKKLVALASSNDPMDRAEPWETTFLRIRPIRNWLPDGSKGTVAVNSKWEGAWPVNLRKSICEVAGAEPEACRLEASAGRICLRAEVKADTTAKLEAWLQAHGCTVEQVTTQCVREQGEIPMARREMIIRDLDICDIDKFSEVGKEILKALLGEEVIFGIRGEPRRMCEGLHWSVVWQVWLPEGTIPLGGKAKLTARGHTVCLLPEKQAYSSPSMGFPLEKRKAPMASAADRPPLHGDSSRERERRRPSVNDARSAPQATAPARRSGNGAGARNQPVPAAVATPNVDRRAAALAAEAASNAVRNNAAARTDSAAPPEAGAAITQGTRAEAASDATTTATSALASREMPPPQPAAAAAANADEPPAAEGPETPESDVDATPPRKPGTPSASSRIEQALLVQANAVRDHFVHGKIKGSMLKSLAQWSSHAVVITRLSSSFMIAPIGFREADREALAQGRYAKTLTLKVSRKGHDLLEVRMGGSYRGEYSLCSNEDPMPSWVEEIEVPA